MFGLDGSQKGNFNDSLINFVRTLAEREIVFITDYCLLTSDQRKIVEDVKVSPSEECITHRKPLICILKAKKEAGIRRKSVHREKI